MTDTVLQSFCERCGTRYTFTEPQETKPEADRGRRSLFGRRARKAPSQPSVSTALPSSDSFRGTFHFCLDCRQYTCTECWNTDAGACISCRPPGEALEHEEAGQHRSAATIVAAEPVAWPSDDVARAQTAPSAAPPSASDSPWAHEAMSAGGTVDPGVAPGSREPASELDEWDQPQAMASPQAPEQAAASNKAESTVDPWRGVLFSVEEEAAEPADEEIAEPTTMADVSAEMTRSRTAVPSPPASSPPESIGWPGADPPQAPTTQPAEPASDWPDADRPADDDEASDDGGILDQAAAKRLEEITSHVDVSDWVRASAAVVGGRQPSEHEVEATAGITSSAAETAAAETEPVVPPLERSEPAVDEDGVNAAMERDAASEPVEALDEPPLHTPQPEPEPEPEPGAPAPEVPQPVPAAAEPAVPESPQAPTSTEPGVAPALTPAAPDEAPQPVDVVPAAATPPQAPQPSIYFEEPQPSAGAHATSEKTPVLPDPGGAPPPAPASPSTTAPITPPVTPSTLEVWNINAEPGPFNQPYEAPATASPPPPPPDTPPPAAQPPAAASAAVTAAGAPAVPDATSAQAPPTPAPRQPPPAQPVPLVTSPVPPHPEAPPPPPTPRAGPRPVPKARANTRACPNCALPLSAKARFCRRCGAPQPQP